MELLDNLRLLMLAIVGGFSIGIGWLSLDGFVPTSVPEWVRLVATPPDRLGLPGEGPMEPSSYRSFLYYNLHRRAVKFF